MGVGGANEGEEWMRVDGIGGVGPISTPPPPPAFVLLTSISWRRRGGRGRDAQLSGGRSPRRALSGGVRVPSECLRII